MAKDHIDALERSWALVERVKAVKVRPWHILGNSPLYGIERDAKELREYISGNGILSKHSAYEVRSVEVNLITVDCELGDRKYKLAIGYALALMVLVFVTCVAMVALIE